MMTNVSYLNGFKLHSKDFSLSLLIKENSEVLFKEGKDKNCRNIFVSRVVLQINDYRFFCNF